VGPGRRLRPGRLARLESLGLSRAENPRNSRGSIPPPRVSNDRLCRSSKEISRCRTIRHPTGRALKNDQRLTRLTSPSRRLSPHRTRSRNRPRSLTMSTAHRSRQPDGALKRRSRACARAAPNQAAALARTASPPSSHQRSGRRLKVDDFTLLTPITSPWHSWPLVLELGAQPAGVQAWQAPGCPTRPAPASAGG
jgi:hypothetical protein